MVANRVGHIGGLVLFLLLAASCQLVGSDPGCRSADDLEPLQAERLACIGWLDYVEQHTCRVVNVDTLSAEQSNRAVYGRANCRERSIMVARRRQDILGRYERIGLDEQVATIVHEAAHLADGCRNGEPPALAAEQAFLADRGRVRAEEIATARARREAGITYFDDLCLINLFAPAPFLLNRADE